MNKTKLHDYQIRALKSYLAFTYDEVEDALLDKYNVSSLEDLNSSDYDAIMEDARELHSEITADKQ